MSRLVWVGVDPYDGVASNVTSNVVDLRDAVAWSFSWRTTSGATSTVTLQISNDNTNLASGNAPAAASWVDDITFGTNASGELIDNVPDGVRFARFQQESSQASIQIDVNKTVG